MKEIVEEYLIVTLMQSHSHRVTFGHIEFYLPTGFPLLKAYWSESPELNICSYTGTQSYANRRTEDLILSGKSFIKLRNRITLGLDRRLDHLKLLVECAHRAMS